MDNQVTLCIRPADRPNVIHYSEAIDLPSKGENVRSDQEDVSPADISLPESTGSIDTAHCGSRYSIYEKHLYTRLGRYDHAEFTAILEKAQCSVGPQMTIPHESRLDHLHGGQHYLDDRTFAEHLHALVPPSTLKLDKDQTITLHLDKLIGHGSLSDGYTGRLVVSSTHMSLVQEESYSIVAKFIRLNSFSRHGHGGRCKRYHGGRALSRVIHEAELYNSPPMRELQGSIVPRFYGLWGGSEGQAIGTETTWPLSYLTVLENVGDSKASYGYVGLDSLSLKEKDEVWEVYAGLHQKGIIHDAMSFKVEHLRRHPEDGKLRLIDFEKSRWVGQGENEVVEESEQLRAHMSYYPNRRERAG